MRPRRIILVRHGESELAVNRDILTHTADHAIHLTERGQEQALAAGEKLKAMLKEEMVLDADGTERKAQERVRFYVSPYQRTRETFWLMSKGLQRDRYDYFEEPRLREQDFGNFQTKAQMEERKAERSRFGHFFYRFHGGESGADVYDRMSTFLETLHRQFLRTDFPPVLVIVTHGLSSRLFLMRWFHWSVEEFECLDNLDHCEMAIMERETCPEGFHKFCITTPLRRWRDCPIPPMMKELAPHLLPCPVSSVVKRSVRDKETGCLPIQFLP
ncbi:histidine phosphatase superfamily [Chytridium lagenaria]|nr:histidine phosphatase superfamily [Chytridium lagenaria]